MNADTETTKNDLVRHAEQKLQKEFGLDEATAQYAARRALAALGLS